MKHIEDTIIKIMSRPEYRDGIGAYDLRRELHGKGRGYTATQIDNAIKRLKSSKVIHRPLQGRMVWELVHKPVPVPAPSAEHILLTREQRKWLTKVVENWIDERRAADPRFDEPGFSPGKPVAEEILEVLR